MQETEQLESGADSYLGDGSVFERIVRGEWVGCKEFHHKYNYKPQFGIKCHSRVSFLIGCGKQYTCSPPFNSGVAYKKIYVYFRKRSRPKPLLPGSWARYKIGIYGDYNFVPVPLVRQFIISQGGEAHLPPILGGVADAVAVEVLEGWGRVAAGGGDTEIEEAV